MDETRLHSSEHTSGKAGLLLAIDPGSIQSGFVLVPYRNIKVMEHGIANNFDLLELMSSYFRHWSGLHRTEIEVVIEDIKSYGMPVGETVFETVKWIGRFQQHAYLQGAICTCLPRMEVKKHICKTTTARDASIRQALIDRFGPFGKKSNPGLMFGLKADSLQAFALAVTHIDKQNNDSFV